jgi:hypothetical protein
VLAVEFEDGDTQADVPFDDADLCFHVEGEGVGAAEPLRWRITHCAGWLTPLDGPAGVAPEVRS